MAYCITLRSRTDTRIITGWYAGSACRWSTDHKRRKVFDNKQVARAVCHELRDLCPRNAKVINIEAAPDDLSREVRPSAIPSPSVYDRTPTGLAGLNGERNTYVDLADLDAEIDSVECTLVVCREGRLTGLTAAVEREIARNMLPGIAGLAALAEGEERAALAVRYRRLEAVLHSRGSEKSKFSKNF